MTLIVSGYQCHQNIKAIPLRLYDEFTSCLVQRFPYSSHKFNCIKISHSGLLDSKFSHLLFNSIKRVPKLTRFGQNVDLPRKNITYMSMSNFELSKSTNKQKGFCYNSSPKSARLKALRWV